MRNRYTSGDYFSSHPTYHVEDSQWKAQQILTMLERHSLVPRNVCEVGCGAGEILKQLQANLPQETIFVGFDISPQAIELCRQRENARLHFICADLLGEEPRVYDLVLCMDVIEHVDDYIGFLRNLRPRGDHHIFHVPLDLSAQTVFRGTPLLERRAEVGHIHFFIKDTALVALSDAGYQVLDWLYTPTGMAKSYGWRNRLARIPRLLLQKRCPDFTARVLGGYSLLILAKGG